MVCHSTDLSQELALGNRSGIGRVTRYRKNGLLFLVLENSHIRTTVLPAIGGKMVELTKKQSGTQFLLNPVQEYSKTRLPYYGADYLQYDPGGFDDCFPTISASAAPLEGDIGDRTAGYFPDHGELWGIPWEYHVSKDSVYMSVQGVRFNYEFSKTIRLEQATVHLKYRVVNLSPVPFNYIWSAQPLLKAQPGSEVVLEQGADCVLLDWTTDPSIGQSGDQLAWPRLHPHKEINYAIIPSPDSNYAAKFHTDISVMGYCGYVRSDTGEKILFEFDPQNVPYVGILLWYNGWPNRSDQKHYAIALQPSKGRPDALQQAYMRNECAEIDAYGMEEWSLQISLI